MTTLDFVTSGEIFRKDNRIVIAQNRHQAAIVPVKLAYLSDGYVAGQCLSLNSTSGLWNKYVANGSSGTDTCVGVLLNDVLNMSTGVAEVGQMIAKGQVFASLCVDLDADAVVDLKGRSVVDAIGNTILMY